MDFFNMPNSFGSLSGMMPQFPGFGNGFGNGGSGSGSGQPQGQAQPLAGGK